MKFIRHLLSHIMFFILIAGIVAIYYFRSQVVPAEYVEKINQYAEKIHPAVVAFKHIEKEVLLVQEQSQPSLDVVADKQIEVEAKVTKEVTKEVKEKVVEEVAVKAEETDDAKAEQVAEKVEVVEVGTEIVVKEETVAPLVVVPLKQQLAKVLPADVPVAVNEVKTVDKPIADAPTPDVAEKTNAVVVAAPVKEIEIVETVINTVTQSSDVAAADYKVMLQSARSLFQNKKFKESINQYKKLIELENHEADFYGELGNVYYAMGSWNMAGEAYFEAAQRLIKTGDLTQVYYLQRVLQGLDKNRAEKLKSHLSGLAR